MQFGVLGPLLVSDGSKQVPVVGARQRVLLSALVVHAGRPVPADLLAERIWDGKPPPGAVITLRSHVMRLRHVLGPAAGPRLVTRFPGYMVDASESEVDVLRFASMYRSGRTAMRNALWQEAVGLLDSALRLWRGAPLADVPSEILHREEVPQLERLRLQTLEWRADAALHLGHHDELVPELQALVAEYPLHERFRGLLMLALYRCGRQAEALASYQEARQVLAAELGIEAGPELRDLHQRMLTADPGLAVPAASSAPRWGAAEADVPRELPAGAWYFTGRASELARLTQLLGHPAAQMPGAVVVIAITGAAGAGKTALAVRWAHQVASRFPDGQLYAGLRGGAPGRPASPAETLAHFLRSLGVPDPRIPPGTDERAARFRSLMAGRRMLIVLDDAASVEQIRPLLPASPECAVVVTSRATLAGLIAHDGAIRLDLGPLAPADAVGVLRSLLGERVDVDPDGAEALAAQCARLPQALRAEAELAVRHPCVTLKDLAVELAGQHGGGPA